MINAILCITILLIFSSVCLTSRIYMFHVLDQYVYPKAYKSQKIRHGVLHDMSCAIWLLTAHALFCTVTTSVVLHKISASSTVAVLDILLFLNIFDAVYFSYTNTRIDKALTENFNCVSIRAMFKPREALVTLFTCVVLILFSILAIIVLSDISSATRGLVLFLFIANTISLLRWLHHNTLHSEAPQATKIEDNEWISIKVQTGMAACANAIASGVLLSLYTQFLRAEKFFFQNSEPLSPTELQGLAQIPLIIPAPSQHKAPSFLPYKRIIIVALESVARDYISLYNPRIPMSSTRFLHYAAQRNLSLTNYYSAGFNTEPGLMATISSRLLNSWINNDPSAETIFELLQKHNFSTYYLVATPNRYNNHANKLPRLYKAEHILTGTELDRLYPDAPRNDWGISDEFIYKHAIQILKQQTGQPICLFLSTLNTHPNFWFSKTDFPSEIQNSPSRLFRSLYQSDQELADFYKELTINKLIDDETLLIVTADHTSNAGKIYQHVTGRDSYQPDKIPCIFITRNTAPLKGIHADRLCSQLDFLPTLCDIMGIPQPATALGSSLFCEARHPMAIQYETPLSIRMLWPHTQVSFNCTEKMPADTIESALQKWMGICMRAAGAS